MLEPVELSDRLLSDQAYAEKHRVRGYNLRIRAEDAHSHRDAANVLISNRPDWTRADHEFLAAEHELAAQMQSERYEQALNRASMETFGRPWSIFDYRISCIGRDEFSTEMKATLRYHGHATSRHKALAKAHAAASASRRIG